MKQRIGALLIVICIASISGYYGLRKEQPASASSNQNTSQQTTKNASISPANSVPKPQEKSFNKSLYSIDDPASIWAVVNKIRPLQTPGYVPPELVVPKMRLRANITSDERQVRKIAAEALEQMSDAATKENVTLTLESGYRSYRFQANLYSRYVNQQGQAVADTQSARPGHSEHQTGLGVDLGGVSQPGCNVEPCFAETVEGKWLASNAHKFGFIIRYPENKTAVTGYIYEPWHVRYMGTELALEMQRSGVSTIEEFFGLPPAPDYN